jgi:hypothetical protein
VPGSALDDALAAVRAAAPADDRALVSREAGRHHRAGTARNRVAAFPQVRALRRHFGIPEEELVLQDGDPS